jgi:hypothetical protein
LNVFEPAGLWSAIRQRLGPRGLPGWLLAIPVLGALGIALAVEFGVRTFNTAWHPVLGYSAAPDDGGARFRALWVALALAPVLQGAVSALLLPLHGRPRLLRDAVAVAAVGSVPLYAAGLALFWLPGILLVLVGFFVSFVWWVNGARELLGVPRSECTDFVMVTLIVSSAMLFLLAAALPL